MSDEQVVAVTELVAELIKEYDIEWVTGLHGDCVGADDEFNTICLSLNMRTICFPCTITGMRAFGKTELAAEPKAPMERNRDIVERAHVMIACPPNYLRIKRGSGTWATIGFTRKAKKPLYIVFPNGKIEKERVDE